MGTLTEAVKQVVGAATKVMIVSVYGIPSSPESLPVLSYHDLPVAGAHLSPPPEGKVSPYACVWVSVRQVMETFMDPVKLNGLLSLHQNLVSHFLSKERTRNALLFSFFLQEAIIHHHSDLRF